MASRGVILIGLVLILCLVNFGSAEDVSSEKDKMGMEVLFEMVHFFLGDIIQTKNISDFLNLSTIFVDDEFDGDQLSDFKGWLDYAKGYAAGAVIGMLFTVLMPIIGLIFCFCRCCGKCGGKRHMSDSRSSKCKRRVYCTLMVVFNTLALAGVICSFMCSHLIHKALENENGQGTVGHIQSSLMTFNNFTNNAVTDVSDTVTRSFDEVAETAIKKINETGSAAVDEVLSDLNATQHLNEARKISKDVNATKVRLENVTRLLKVLSNDSGELQSNLTSIRNKIDSVCNTGSCDGYNPDHYDIKANFSSLKVLEDETQKVSKAMDLSQYVQEAEDEIDKAKKKAKNDVDDTISRARTSIHDVQEKVATELINFRKQKDDLLSFYPSTNEDLNRIDNDIKDKYSSNVYYGCIGVSCVYLLIVVFYYVGIVFGLCGERPGHGAPCCNRGTGASCLMAGVYFTFIFSWILMTICTVLFVVGGISYTEVCQYFDGHHPDNFKFFDETLNNGLDLKKALYDDPTIKFSLSQSLRDCQQNKAIFTAFKMDNIFDLDETINVKDLQDELDKLEQDDVTIAQIEIISDDLKNKLEEFANAGIQNIAFDDYFSEFDRLNKSLTIEEIGVLYNTINALADDQTNSQSKATLREQAKRLKSLRDDVIPKLQEDVKQLKAIFNELKDTSNIHNSIAALIQGLTKSQSEFNAHSSDRIKEKFKAVADNIVFSTNSSMDTLKFKIKTDTAKCQPLSDSLYAVSDSVCVLLVDPLNGMWFSFGWCLFFFVLCLIFGVLLAGEYQHEYKFGKEFDDPFDTRSHDMMPLTSHSNMDRHRSQEPMRHHQHQHHQHHQQPLGLHNSAYSPEMKRMHSSAPPPYGQHIHHPGEWSVEGSPYTTKSSQMMNGR